MLKALRLTAPDFNPGFLLIWNSVLKGRSNRTTHHDHVHLLIKSSKSVSDSDFMKALKGGSSRWINDIDLIPGHFKWQAGYGWFSVSPKDTSQVATSIENQAEHHKKATFQDEYRRFLKTYQIDYDEGYVWD